jgi:scyllo-inositol 2-dehydrogenase (NAD+)
MLTGAVIGCGRMGVFTSEAVRVHAPRFWMPQSHADAMAAHPGIALAALCDPAPAALERAAAAHPGARTFAGHEEMLAEIRPDLAGIATRTIGRTAIIEQAAAAGTRALHIEKPICNSVEELGRLEALFAAPDLFVSYGTLRRYFRIYRDAFALASSGELGEIHEVRFDAGPGQLFWSHPHSVDLILCAAGEREVVAVQARLGALEPGESPGLIRNDPDVLAADIWFEGGMRGSIGRAMGAALHIACARGVVIVRGNGAALEVDALEGGSPYPVRRTVAVAADYSAPEGSLAPIGGLVDCLNGSGEAIAANARMKRDILKGQRLLFAMVESHLRGGAEVAPGDISPDRVILGRTGELYA